MGEVGAVFPASLGDRVKVRRRTSFVVDLKKARANPAIDRDPGRAALLRVTMDTPAGGTVIMGAAAGPVEHVAFSAGDRRSRITAGTFSTLDGLTLQGLAGATFSIQAVLPTGEPALFEYTVDASVPCKWMALDGRRIRFQRRPPGQIQEGQFRMLMAWDADVQNGDVIVPVSGSMLGLTLGEVIGVYGLGDFDGITHHLEVDVRRI